MNDLRINRNYDPAAEGEKAGMIDNTINELELRACKTKMSPKAIEKALRHVRDAFDAGRGPIGVQTFEASMGIA